MFLYFSDWHCPSASGWSCWGPRNWQSCWQRDPSWCSHAPGPGRTCWTSPWSWWAIPTGEALGERHQLLMAKLKNRRRVHNLRKSPECQPMIFKLLVFLLNEMHKRYFSQLNLSRIFLQHKICFLTTDSTVFPKNVDGFLNLGWALLNSGLEKGSWAFKFDSFLTFDFA
jgi:hypothetical protein